MRVFYWCRFTTRDVSCRLSVACLITGMLGEVSVNRLFLTPEILIFPQAVRFLVPRCDVYSSSSVEGLCYCFIVSDYNML